MAVMRVPQAAQRPFPPPAGWSAAAGGPEATIRATFVMEQALGHVTHYENLRRAAGEHGGLTATWLPIPFEVQGPSRFVPVLRSNWSVRASWRARQAVRGVLAAHEQHVLLFHTQVTALFSPAIMRRVPAVVSLDATPINYDSVGRYYGHRPAGRGFLDRQKYRLNRQVFHQAAALVAWSEWARRSLVQDYGVDYARTHVIAPGAAPEFFDLGDRRLRWPAASAAPAAPAVIGRGALDDEGRLVRLLFVGADFERKGGPLLLECMRQGLAERCELHVVTQADVAPQPNVYVHRGVRPNSPQLYDLFAQADVFVLPSHAECLAIVLMEATAAGLPVVTTDVGALREAVVEGESGMVIPAGDVRALWHALTTLAGDRLLRRRMSVAGLTLARQKFDARRNNGALLDVVCAAARAGLLPHQTRSLA